MILWPAKTAFGFERVQSLGFQGPQHLCHACSSLCTVAAPSIDTRLTLPTPGCSWDFKRLHLKQPWISLVWPNRDHRGSVRLASLVSH